VRGNSIIQMEVLDRIEPAAAAGAAAATATA
jgi:hypothetical protein